MAVPDVQTPDDQGPGLATGQPLEGITVPGTGHVPVAVEQLDTGEFRISVGHESAIIEHDDGVEIGRLLVFDRTPRGDVNRASGRIA